MEVRPKRKYTELWASKMRAVFRLLDKKQLGYITEETLKEELKLIREVHPEVDEVTLKKQNQYTWRNFYNNGQDTPKGYRLTEKAFVNNLWITVNQPNFMKEMERLGRETFGRMDFQQKGYVTKKEYVKMITSTLGEELAGAVFDAMDKDRKGKLLVDELIRAKYFYYTDLSDESNPINLMYGPLE